MKRFILQLVTLMLVFSSSVAVVLAGPIKVHVAECTVTGAANRDELKSALQGLLASRIADDKVLSIDNPNGVDALIACSYISLGKVFSIDAVVSSSKGETLGRSYVQGEGQDDLIPAIGKLAQQLQPILLKAASAAASEQAAKVAVPLAVPAVAGRAGEAAGAAAAAAGASQPVAKGAMVGTSDVIQAQQAGVIVTPPGDIIRADVATTRPLIPQTRIEGAMIGIAPGRDLSGGDREFVVAGQQVVRLYQQGKELKKTAEYSISGDAKILGIDTADLDNDGVLEIYVTIMEEETLSSRVLSIGDKGFTVIAERLPYYFRAIALEGKTRKVYAQQIGKDDEDFYGDVREIVKKGNAFTMGAAIKVPQYANVFTFNRFADADGKQYQVILDEDGYLRVLDDSGELLWKSGDRYGGSEVYFKRDEQQMQPISVDRYRWRFLEQRVVVTDKGLVIVPRNSGLFVVGNNRSFTKNTVYAYAWTGVSLDERWRTKESQNYLADYFYEGQRKELVMLEVVKKEGLFDKGASTITIKKVE